jgi:hypothetical protein
MDYITSAIKVKKVATSSLDSVTGPIIGFDLSRAAFPRLHIVKHELGGRGVEYTFGTKAFEFGFVRMIVLDDDPDDLRTIIGNVETAFNAIPTGLTATTGTILSFLRKTPWSIDQNPALSTLSLPIYQGFAEFEFNYQF